MNLITWHDRLHQHFQEVHQERVVEGGLVFVLEHGFSLTEIGQLEADIRAYIQKHPPTDKHWLPWIVYAAELGYNYVGQEYWQTFEASTAGWRERGRERDWVRDKFKKFECDYGGAVPSGPWAQHFNIICHPITHAILPKDFQSQLTEVLYTIRHLFTVQNLQSSELLGELIASHSLQQSKRFQQFVQDIQIVGLIAKALLNQEESHTGKILLPSTLQRIVTDLGREGVALDQLRDARHSAQSTQRRGLSSGRSSRTTSYAPRTSEQDAVVIEPRLVLRRTTATSWETMLEIPDFTPLLDKRPTWRRFLEQTRAAVTGSRTMLARGRLLFGTNTIQLRTCPDMGKPLLTFEDDEAPDELKRFIEKNFSINTSATILCRIASDGRAYQSRGTLVRPGRNYLVLSTAGQIRSSRFTSNVNTTCEGLHAVQLSVPETTTPDCESLIKRLGLKITRQISVFPVGVAAAEWDNEGYAEWLTSDEPCIGIHVGHQTEVLLLELDDEEESNLEVYPEEAGQTVFVQMPPLSKGQYQLRVSSRFSANDDYEEVGQLQITIRDPRSWKSAINEQGALITIVEPRKPTIEQLVRGAAGIEMHGPAGHMVQVTATFFGKQSTTPVMWAPIGMKDGSLDLGDAYASDVERVAGAVERACGRLGRPVTVRDVRDEIEMDPALEPAGRLQLRNILSDISKETIDAGDGNRRSRVVRRCIYVGKVKGDSYYCHDAGAADEARSYVRLRQLELRWSESATMRELTAYMRCSLPSVAVGQAMLVKTEAETLTNAIDELLRETTVNSATRHEAELLRDEVSGIMEAASQWLVNSDINSPGIPRAISLAIPGWTASELLEVFKPFYPAAKEMESPHRLTALISKKISHFPNPEFESRFSKVPHKASENLYDRADALLFAATRWGGHECRMQAMMARSEVGTLRDPRFVYPALKSAMFEERLRGVAGLAFLWSADGNKRLRHLALNDHVPAVRQSALWAYGFAGGEGAQELLQQRAESDPDERTRYFFKQAMECLVTNDGLWLKI